MEGIHRIGIPRVPPSVVREVIANALVHRSYAEQGPVQVRLGPDDFTVSSPGGLPPGVTLGNLLDQSRPRSVVLAEAFKRAGLVDRAGRGVRQMFGSLLRGGRGEPDYTHTITEYGSITRSQVMGLVMVDSSQARGILRRLIDAGTVELRGQRRGAHYVLASRAQPS